MGKNFFEKKFLPKPHLKKLYTGKKYGRYLQFKVSPFLGLVVKF